MDRDGEMVLSMPPYHSGMATLVPSTDHNQWLKQTIPVRDVANYLPPLIDGRPFGVKIDVEGAEVYLMPWLLRQPTVLSDI